MSGHASIGEGPQPPAPSVFIKTYGCQMNERDSEAVTALLLQHGYGLASSETEADVLIVNTCSVREKAEDKALGKLRMLAAGKSARPGRIVGAVGCMVQRLGAATLARVKGLDFAVGTHRLAALPSVIEAARAGYGPVLETGEDAERPRSLTGHVAGGVSAFVTVLLGCNRHCAYCVVPTVRGREWSRPATEVLDEVRALAAQGVREVTLLGQSVMSYGRANAVWDARHVSPRGYAEPLPRLLEALNGLEGLRRLRFTSGHPSGCTAELAAAMAGLAAVCDHLHLPVQSGSNRILERMRRGYTAEEYGAAVARLRGAVPGLALTTDIIVGFPGETEADFELTRRLMDEVGFDNAFIFKYSPRAGTPAAEWGDDVTPQEKLRRNHVLLQDLDRYGLAINRALVGRALDVLVEGPSLRDAARWSGRTTTNKIVIFEPSQSVKVGDIVTVRIEQARAQTLYGSV